MMSCFGKMWMWKYLLSDVMDMKIASFPNPIYIVCGYIKHMMPFIWLETEYLSHRPN